MRSCFSLMLGMRKIKELNFDTALFLDEDIRWLSINKTYYDRKQYFNLLINSTYNFAEKNVYNSKDKISDYILQNTSDFLEYKLNDHDYKAIHLWKYAMTDIKNNFGSLIDENLKIIVCGDWCMDGKVEGGFLSAKDATNKLLKYI